MRFLRLRSLAVRLLAQPSVGFLALTSVLLPFALAPRGFLADPSRVVFLVPLNPVVFVFPSWCARSSGWFLPLRPRPLYNRNLRPLCNSWLQKLGTVMRYGRSGNRHGRAAVDAYSSAAGYAYGARRSYMSNSCDTYNTYTYSYTQQAYRRVAVCNQVSPKKKLASTVPVNLDARP